MQKSERSKSLPTVRYEHTYIFPYGFQLEVLYDTSLRTRRRWIGRVPASVGANVSTTIPLRVPQVPRV
jgi:hypothetical protein